MLDRKFIFIAVGVVTAAIAGIAWAYYDRTADAAKVESEIVKQLSEDDLSTLLESQANAGDAQVAELAASKEARQAFANGIKEHLALAAEARRTGLNNDERFQINFDLKQCQLLADLYQVNLGHSIDKPYRPSEQELNELWSDPSNEAAFKKDMETLASIQNEMNRKLGNNIAPGVLAGESLTRAKASWARAKLLSNRALADKEFMSRRDVQLRLKVLEAGILSKDLLRTRYEKEIKATDEEIRQFIAEHPEYSVAAKLTKAQEVLKKAKAGEDFTQLAATFSEHRPTAKTGGLIEGMLSGDQPENLEAAMLTLKPGELYPNVIETEQGFHVAKLIARSERTLADGRKIAQYSFRQVLLQKKFEQPGLENAEIPPPFMTAEEIAKVLIEQRKRDAFVADVMKRNPISM